MCLMYRGVCVLIHHDVSLLFSFPVVFNRNEFDNIVKFSRSHFLKCRLSAFLENEETMWQFWVYDTIRKQMVRLPC